MTFFASSSNRGFYSSEENKIIPEDAVEITDEYRQALLEGANSGTGLYIDWSVSPPTLKQMEKVWPTAKELADKLDTRIADIYSTWTRFEAEYTFRERAAQAFKDAGYEGDPGIWVTSFATAADLDNTTAANKILEQSANLRWAQETLGALRMRKYELNDLTGEACSLHYEALCTEISDVVAQIG